MANYGCGSIMEKDKDQINRERNPEKSRSDNIYNEKDKRLEEGLPMEDSPYLQYKNLGGLQEEGIWYTRPPSGTEARPWCRWPLLLFPVAPSLLRWKPPSPPPPPRPSTGKECRSFFICNFHA